MASLCSHRCTVDQIPSECHQCLKIVWSKTSSRASKLHKFEALPGDPLTTATCVAKQARKLQATLVRNYDLLTGLLTGVRCRATSVAKKHPHQFHQPLHEMPRSPCAALPKKVMELRYKDMKIDQFDNQILIYIEPMHELNFTITHRGIGPRGHSQNGKYWVLRGMRGESR